MDQVMDISVIFPQYIFEKILNHVSSKELNELTTVSKSWYDAITSSYKLMKRFYLSIRGDWMNKGDFPDVVSCSKRKFQKVLISDVTEIFYPVYNEILGNSSNYWKAVEIYGLTLNTQDEYINLVKTFESSVETLSMSSIKILDVPTEPVKFNMKNLRNLRISFCDKELTSGALQSAPNLLSLELLSASEYDDNVFHYLKGISTLKMLELRGEWFTKFSMNCQVSEVKFQLKNLSVACIDYTIPKKVTTNFLNFLEGQHEIMKINLSEWFGLEIVYCMFQMKNLKEMTTFVSPFFRWGLNNLPLNKSLEMLDVRTLDVTDELYNLLMMLSAAPNLKTVCLRTINGPLAYFMKRKLKSLSKISLVHSCNSDEIKAILPHVEFV